MAKKSGRFTPCDLLIWLTGSDEAKSIEVVYQGDPFEIRKVKYVPGKKIALGSRAGFHALTGISVESQINLLAARNKLDRKGRKLPANVTVPYWINWAALLQALEKQGVDIPLVYHDKPMPDGTYAAWRQLRDDYENSILEPQENYYSPAIGAILTPTSRKGVAPLTLTARKGQDNAGIPVAVKIAELLAELSPTDRSRVLLEMLPTKKSQSVLSDLISRYMDENGVTTTEDLAIRLLAQYKVKSPQEHPQFAAIVEMLGRLIEGAGIDQADPGYLPTAPGLADLLLKPNGSKFDGLQDLVDYCLGEQA